MDDATPRPPRPPTSLTPTGPMPEGWTLPRLDAANRAWFEPESTTGPGTVPVQTCAQCGTRQHPPEEMCHRCGTTDLTSTQLGTDGVVHSYTVVHYPVNPALAEAVPYAVVLVALNDDPAIRILGNVLDCPPADVYIGMAVTATWEERADDQGTVKLLQWQPCGPKSALHDTKLTNPTASIYR